MDVIRSMDTLKSAGFRGTEKLLEVDQSMTSNF